MVKKVINKMNCYILHTVKWSYLLFIIAVISYYYSKDTSKQKCIGVLTI